MFPRGLYEVSDGVTHREPDVQQQHLHEVEPGQGVQHLLHGARLVLGPGGQRLKFGKIKIYWIFYFFQLASVLRLSSELLSNLNLMFRDFAMEFDE